MTEPLDLRSALRAAGPTVDATTADVCIGLAASFTPLHLATFLRANARMHRSGSSVAVNVGRYGDLVTAIADAAAAPATACCVLLDWRDLDPRLGVRETITARSASADDVLRTARQRADRIVQAILGVAERLDVVVVLPVTAISPIYATGGPALDVLRAGLDAVVADLASRMTAGQRVTVLRSSQHGVFDLAGEIRSGCPMPVETLAVVAAEVAAALWHGPRKKGVITDLDDTLWRGIVGEVGPDGVTWDLDAGSHVHAVYQRLLAELADEGVLIAAVSKNDQSVVDNALKRQDLLIGAEQVFPVYASWGAKSDAVSAVLRTWNIGAQDVVFVDDSALELAEVSRQHPEIGALRFPTRSPTEAWALFDRLRHLFPRRTVGDEDRLRMSSIRVAERVEHERNQASDDIAFLSDLDGTIAISNDVVADARPLELVNKTNQFTLDATRHDSGSWQALVARPGSVACAVGYEDRFGRLGTISVLAGVLSGRVLDVDCWVLSCRAFSRAIEVSLLAALAEKLELDTIVVRVKATERNQVARDLLASLGDAGDHGVAIEREDLLARPQSSVHKVEFLSDVRVQTSGGDGA